MSKYKMIHHDGEKLGFYKKSKYQNTEQEELSSCHLYLGRNEEFQFIWQ